MREAYQEQLRKFAGRLAELTRLTDEAMQQATRAVTTDDLALAELVVRERKPISDLHHVLDEHALSILACQQPVATDLRTIIAGLRMSADLDRMGALAHHVGEIVVRRHPRRAVPDALRPTIRAMGGVAHQLVTKVGEAMVARDAAMALEIAQDDDAMDRLLHDLYRELTSGTRQPDVDTIMDLTLIGRYYERYADHAVSLGKRIAYLARTSA
ncbi:phosphate signaling complex protein PhoU [Prauserella oleivorans]|uniref:Phosphate-specific transport system accessory protein PhoU n=1 Tax=Prauserella oleivorans TaxID=1478153 RepID=A0ABW5W9Z1_9PSEU